jgi:hypothetical protein
MSSKLNFHGKLKNTLGGTADVEVNLVQFKDNDCYVLYAPALEVYGYGKTVEESKNSFITCLEEFINYTLSKGTLTAELKRLGWKIKGTKSKRQYKTPVFSDLLSNNDRLIDIINERNVRTYKADIPMALPA